MNCPVAPDACPEYRRNQVSACRIAELVALEQQEFVDYRIDARHAECRLQRGINAWHRRAPTGSTGSVVLMNVPGERPLRCRVP